MDWPSPKRPDRAALLAAFAAGAVLFAAPEGASAFDFFGLFGSDTSPPASKTAIAYRVAIDVQGGDGAITS
ncbi:MAG TPA: hypothetical protein VEH77_17115, partial [Roseiarcus sp.]|nr:hypothetical protein [Roseiarcus sp.]